MSMEGMARRLAGILRQLTENDELATYHRQGTVNATHTGPRRVDVELEGEGEVPDVALLDHQVMPSVGQAVWIVRVRPGGWLYAGRQA